MIKLRSYTLIMTITLMAIFTPSIKAQNNISCAGCKTEYFLIKELAKAYKTKTGIVLKVAKTGNKKAVHLTLGNKTDFAFTCKPISKLSKKFKIDQKKISEWVSTAIAKDPIILVSNKENGITNLSVDQITKIFLGETKNWKELSGNNLPILPASLSPKLESGVTTVFKENTGGKDMKFPSNIKYLNGPSMLGNYVSSKPGAIGFIGYNSYKKKYGDILKVENISPTKETISNNTYKFSTVYYLTIPNKNKKIQDFLNFCLSAEGQKIIAKNFFVYNK